MKSAYELSLTDERIAELHAGKPIRVCDDVFYAKLREREDKIVINRHQAKEDSDIEKIQTYLIEHPNKDSNQIADACQMKQSRAVRILNDHPELFDASKAHRNVLYRVA